MTVGREVTLDTSSDRTWSVAFWVLVIVFAVASVIPVLPDTTTPSDGISAPRAVAHVEATSSEPHGMGSPANQKVRDYILGELVDVGFRTEEQTFQSPDYYGSPGNTVELTNVMARLKDAGEPAIVLIAHYDTDPKTPGANDNAANVAIVLEVARILSSSDPMANDVIFLFTDGEEPNPRPGSNTFVDSHPWFDDIEFVINLEASGAAGPSLLAQTSGSETAVIDSVAQSEVRPAVYSFLTEIARLLGEIGTDFDRFQAEGVPGVNLAYLHDAPVYHTGEDSIENLGVNSLRHQGAAVLALIQEIGDQSLRNLSGDDTRAFFTLLDHRIVAYPVAWALPLALLAVILMGIGMFRKHETGNLAAAGGLALLFSLLAAIVATIAWMLVTSWRTAPGLGEAYLWLAVSVVVLVFAWLALRRRFPTIDIGVVSVWGLLAVVTAFVAPATSYLFSWPAIAGGLLLMVRKQPGPPALLRSVLVGLSLLVTVPAVDVLFQLSQPRPGNPDSELLPVIALVGLMATLIVALFSLGRPTRAG